MALNLSHSQMITIIVNSIFVFLLISLNLEIGLLGAVLKKKRNENKKLTILLE
jgi:hypothetical protein